MREKTERSKKERKLKRPKIQSDIRKYIFKSEPSWITHKLIAEMELKPLNIDFLQKSYSLG